jgi:hypothetical protein
MARRKIDKEPLTRLEDGSADVQAVVSWSSGLPDSFIMCRDMGHMWRPFMARISPEWQNAYDRTLRCGRCKTERAQVIGLDGQILRSGYVYTDGYLTPLGSGRITGEGRGALRLESTLRLISKEDRD